jgi:hypothetical protein
MGGVHGSISRSPLRYHDNWLGRSQKLCILRHVFIRPQSVAAMLRHVPMKLMLCIANVPLLASVIVHFIWTTSFEFRELYSGLFNALFRTKDRCFNVNEFAISSILGYSRR